MPILCLQRKTVTWSGSRTLVVCMWPAAVGWDPRGFPMIQIRVANHFTNGFIPPPIQTLSLNKAVVAGVSPSVRPSVAEADQDHKQAELRSSTTVATNRVSLLFLVQRLCFLTTHHWGLFFVLRSNSLRSLHPLS
jgi:hypothetical protein